MTAQTDYAVTVTAYERVELLPVERDATPLGAHEVAGRTLATLISAGTELSYNYRGSKFPTMPGYAAVFEVEAVGSELTDIAVGDHVFCMGGHRSYQRIDSKSVIKLPPGLAPQTAVFARLMGVSMSTLTTTTARPPQKVVVSGLGPVGHLAAKIFASCGYEVIACDPVAMRRDLLVQAGVAEVYDKTPLDQSHIAGQVALVVECSGHEQAVLDGCQVVQKRGEVVLVGVPWQRKTELTAQELLHAIFHRYVVVRSGWEWELPLHRTEFRNNSIFDNLTAALRWLAQGRIQVDALYATMPPHEAQQAYQNLLHNRLNHLAVVFDWNLLQKSQI